MLKPLQMRYTLMLFLVVGTLSGTTPATAAVVSFPDTNLRAEVRDTLNIPTAHITSADMKTIEMLWAWNKSITNIGGLEYATNLTSLDLGYNLIHDISAIGGLNNLTSLDLNYNWISDISPVTKLKDLSWLYLYNNQISDISAISGLTNLTCLDLCSNQINNISAISGLTNLWFLKLTGNQINNISAVSGLTNLGGLDLCGNQISDISVVSNLTNLYYLHLQNNQISNISVVAGLANLTDLSLSNNQISDTSAVSGLTNLSSLHLANNQIKTLNLSNSNLTSLQEFSITGNPITSVLLVDTTLSQTSFDVLMGNFLSHFNAGIATLDGVSNLDMSDVDFAEILDLSSMCDMDDLETLLLARATNLEGSKVVALTNELDSLNWLDVTGLWETFDAGAQESLLAWDAIEGNTLVTTVPEPAMLAMVLALVGVALLWRRGRLV